MGLTGLGDVIHSSCTGTLVTKLDKYGAYADTMVAFLYSSSVPMVYGDMQDCI